MEEWFGKPHGIIQLLFLAQYWATSFSHYKTIDNVAVELECNISTRNIIGRDTYRLVMSFDNSQLQYTPSNELVIESYMVSYNDEMWRPGRCNKPPVFEKGKGFVDCLMWNIDETDTYGLRLRVKHDNGIDIIPYQQNFTPTFNCNQCLPIQKLNVEGVAETSFNISWVEEPGKMFNTVIRLNGNDLQEFDSDCTPTCTSDLRCMPTCKFQVSALTPCSFHKVCIRMQSLTNNECSSLCKSAKTECRKKHPKPRTRQIPLYATIATCLFLIAVMATITLWLRLKFSRRREQQLRTDQENLTNSMEEISPREEHHI